MEKVKVTLVLSGFSNGGLFSHWIQRSVRASRLPSKAYTFECAGGHGTYELPTMASPNLHFGSGFSAWYLANGPPLINTYVLPEEGPCYG